MSCSSVDESDLSESDLEEYSMKWYQKLKNDSLEVRVSDEKYKCPFCPGKARLFQFKDLHQHASGVANGSQKRKIKERGKHLGLARYMENDLDRTEQLMELSMNTSQDSEDRHADERFVFPWIGIVANVPRQRRDGRYVGESGSKLKDDLSNKGLNPLRVQTLWNYKAGFSGYALVEFSKDWPGFSKAVTFEKMFEGNHHGKKDYYDSSDKGSDLYGWVAREDDYNSDRIFGEYLRKKGDLKTIVGLQEEEDNKASQLVSNLTTRVEMGTESIKEIESKYNETSLSLNNLMIEKDELHQYYEDELRKMKEKANTQLESIFSQHEAKLSQLEAQRRKLLKREAELGKREALNNMERKKLDHQKEMNEKATAEQMIANEKMLKLAEEHKKEKQKLGRQIIEIQKKIDAKQALELEIQRLRGAIQIREHIGNDGDEEDVSKFVDIQNDLKEKEEELEAMDATNQALIAKERNSNDELQEARKEIIQAMKDKTSRIIGVKRMGELDVAPFREAVQKTLTLPKSEVQVRAMLLCSQWQAELSDSHWYPFKMVKVGGSEEHEQIVDSDDEKLKMLRTQWGNEAYEAVVTALKEMNEYNPSGRYPVPELWNFKQNKKATLKEAISPIVEQWKKLKRRK